MKWPEFLSRFGDQPVLESGMLLAWDDSPADVQRQLSRWVRSGRLLQLRRGLYSIAEPHACTTVSPFVVANRLQFPSYVSLESALAFHGVIPEGVPNTTSVTTRRPRTYETGLGTFSFRHLKRSLFWGYERISTRDGGSFVMASAEKALLDLVHLTPGRVTEAYVEELRLEPGLDIEKLQVFAERTGKPKLIHAAKIVKRVLNAGREV